MPCMKWWWWWWWWSSSSSELKSWVGLCLLKQMSPSTSILGIRQPISKTQFPCAFLYPFNPSWFRSARSSLTSRFCIQWANFPGPYQQTFVCYFLSLPRYPSSFISFRFVAVLSYGVELLVSRPNTNLEGQNIPFCLRQYPWPVWHARP